MEALLRPAGHRGAGPGAPPAPPGQIPGLASDSLAARSAPPRFTTSPAAIIGGRDEKTPTNQRLLTQASSTPLPLPPLESHSPSSISFPPRPSGGGGSAQSSSSCSGGAGRGGGVCHLVTLIFASSQTRSPPLSQSSC